MIGIQDVSKSYGEKSVIENIHLTIKKQCLTAFIGPNGAGKSTLLSVVSRLLEADIGEIYLDHQEVKAWHSNELAQKLSILKQSNSVNLRITVRDLVSFGRFPYSKGRLDAKDHQLVDEAIGQLGLQEEAEKTIDTLSGGQLQRAYIAMILAQDTDYILLDEPLNNLDMNFAVQLMKTLRRLVDEAGKTIILVIHDVNFAASYSDEIVAMKDGKIFAHGATETIIQRDVLSTLYEMDVKIGELEGKRVCLYF